MKLKKALITAITIAMLSSNIFAQDFLIMGEDKKTSDFLKVENQNYIYMPDIAHLLDLSIYNHKRPLKNGDKITMVQTYDPKKLEITFVVGENCAYRNGEKIKQSTGIKIINGGEYVPFDLLLNEFGLKSKYIDGNKIRIDDTIPLYSDGAISLLQEEYAIATPVLNKTRITVDYIIKNGLDYNYIIKNQNDIDNTKKYISYYSNNFKLIQSKHVLDCCGSVYNLMERYKDAIENANDTCDIVKSVQYIIDDYNKGIKLYDKELNIADIKNTPPITKSEIKNEYGLLKDSIDATDKFLNFITFDPYDRNNTPQTTMYNIYNKNEMNKYLESIAKIKNIELKTPQAKEFRNALVNTSIAITSFVSKNEIQKKETNKDLPYDNMQLKSKYKLSKDMFLMSIE